MNIKYKIIEVYPENHSIVVRFYTDLISEESLATQITGGVVVRGRTDYSIDLPRPLPEGDALAAFISARAPKAWLETQEAILDPAVDTSLTAVMPLLGVETDAVVAEIIKTDLINAVQAHLDAGAQELGYDDIKTAATYAGEAAVPRFQNEGIALRSWRSLVWEHCHGVMNAVTAGERAVPTAAELIGELPVLQMGAA